VHAPPQVKPETKMSKARRAAPRSCALARVRAPTPRLTSFGPFLRRCARVVPPPPQIFTAFAQRKTLNLDELRFLFDGCVAARVQSSARSSARSAAIGTRSVTRGARRAALLPPALARAARRGRAARRLPHAARQRTR
jgi:hypothetical protein